MSPASRKNGRLEVQVFGGDPAAGEAVVRKMHRAGRQGHRTRQDHDAVLRDVATTYRKHLVSGHPAPRDATRREMNLSNSYVGRLLYEARRTDPPLLGPAPIGRAGELERPRSARKSTTKKPTAPRKGATKKGSTR